MKTRSVLRLLGCAGALLAATLPHGAAFAKVPGTLTHQGRLYAESGDPVNDTLDVVFDIYEAPAAQTPLWSETHTITFEDGYFSVSLGSDKPLDGLVLDGSERYL